MAKTAAELQSIVRAEKSRSVGFDIDALLVNERREALEYFKGEMRDIPALPNRSKAVSTDLADAVETLLPDLMEIFTSGDNVVSFNPQNPDDEEAAEQETAYLHWVVFDQNEGFSTLLSLFQDTLLEKNGVVKVWWEEGSDIPDETFEGKTAFDLMAAMKDGQVYAVEQDPEPDENGQPTFSFKLRKQGPDGIPKIKAFAPEDFTVARDTVRLCETTYCAARSRPRAYQLVAQGYDKDQVDALPVYGIQADEQVQLARDTAGEHKWIVEGEGPDRDHRVVEIIDHYVRVLEGTDVVIYNVVTGANETIVLDHEVVNRIPFHALTAFPMAHRFYGLSLHDKLKQIQRIKTALTRASLDSSYFALNQRHEVDMSGTNEWTFSDLLNNVPGAPVRVDRAGTVTPLANGGEPYDYFQALEYFSTEAEKRTGVVRNAQGLDPDTLHDTAAGAAMLINAAQKRTRFIARVFAETGVKDLFLAVHALIREHASQRIIKKLRGDWIDLDPTQWAERAEMTVEVGGGADGRDGKKIALAGVQNVQGAIVKLLGGMAQKVLTPTNIYNSAMDLSKASGLKHADRYFTDPAKAAPDQPQPDPEAAKQQAQQQHEQQLAQQQAQTDAQQQQASQQHEAALAQAQAQQQAALAQMTDQREREKLASDQTIARAKLQADAAKADEELRLKGEAQNAAHALAVRKLEMDHQFRMAQLQQGALGQVIDAHQAANSDATDLAVQASESVDAHLMAHHDRVHDATQAELDRQHQMTMAHVSAALAPKPETKDEGGDE